MSKKLALHNLPSQPKESAIVDTVEESHRCNDASNWDQVQNKMDCSQVGNFQFASRDENSCTAKFDDRNSEFGLLFRLTLLAIARVFAKKAFRSGGFDEKASTMIADNVTDAIRQQIDE